mgnify:CR=1 FL=1
MSVNLVLWFYRSDLLRVSNPQLGSIVMYFEEVPSASIHHQDNNTALSDPLPPPHKLLH